MYDERLCAFRTIYVRIRISVFRIVGREKRKVVVELSMSWVEMGGVSGRLHGLHRYMSYMGWKGIGR